MKIDLNGGSWDYLPRYARASTRCSYAPANRYPNVGFRCLTGWGSLVLLRGVTYFYPKRDVRGESRIGRRPHEPSPAAGFRCVRSARRRS